MNCLIFLSTLFLLIWKCSCLSIDLHISDDKYNIKDLPELISTFAYTYNEINFYIDYTSYTFDLLDKIPINIPADTNVSIIGNGSNQRSVFDYSVKQKGFTFYFAKYTGQHIIIKNIDFINFVHERASDDVFLFFFDSVNTNYNIEYINCSFENFNSMVLKVDVPYNELINNLHDNFHFNSCIFRNINGYGVFYMNNKGFEINSNSIIKVSNSEFINCSDILRMDYGYFIFDNCIFTNISSSIGIASFVYMRYNSTLTIQNSKFYDINIVDKIIPFIIAWGNELK
ncbi:hypothetical protein BCR32DRAFT_245476 [Anaeromyces robustus]|uniref:Right handed beta helix domain-containing protein n=1 Tax=Anaeromyces robustus TaxID=1754192 RepID=A0A1Y1X4C2_9FUNG|nr:hypothetical protein BCR32DRAFT_245476 [Anaeromyces robustus]|eukprot:ORX80661.1 hypothetical protein BCR32DRAFT_245476 [Anaeromyces robustus]